MLTEKAKVFLVDAESVDACDAYGPLLRSLDDLTTGALGIAHLTFVEGASRIVRVERADGTTFELTLAGNTDSIDKERLVEQLNLMLAGTELRLITYWSQSFGQQIAFAALPGADVAALTAWVAARKEHEIFEQVFPDGDRPAIGL